MDLGFFKESEGILKRAIVMDIRRAFLHAPMVKEVYIELPQEAKSESDGDCVGRLLKAMYGTREAPLS